MKLKIAVLAALLVLFSLRCSKKTQEGFPAWEGTVEYKNGVKVIKNPGESLYGHLILDVEIDLSLGREGDETSLFYRLEDIGVDSQGNIYVLDIGNHRIQKYNNNGDYLQTIGRKGQGPGEFDTPYGMFISLEDMIYVHDGMRLKVFASDGKFREEIVLENFTHDISVDSNRNIWGVGRLPSDEGRTRSIVKLSQNGKLEKVIADFPPPEVAVRSEGGRGVMFFIGHVYVPSLSILSLGEKNTLYAHSSDYAIHVIDEWGELELIIRVDAPRSLISQREKDEIYRRNSEFEKKWPKDVVRDAIHFPNHRPFFSSILTDDKGRIYVERVKSVLDESTGIEFDILSRDGRFLYTTKLPVAPEIIKNGFFYVVHSNEETGETLLQRFKINNWAEIKKE